MGFEPTRFNPCELEAHPSYSHLLFTPLARSFAWLSTQLRMALAAWLRIPGNGSLIHTSSSHPWQVRLELLVLGTALADPPPPPLPLPFEYCKLGSGEMIHSWIDISYTGVSIHVTSRRQVCQST